MSLRALVVGGTGPTGPHIVDGLVDRGYEVTVLHSGRHEVEGLRATTHLHVDPYDTAALAGGLEDREFDIAIATYGRLRDISALLADRTERFMSVGAFAAYRDAVAPHPASFPPGPRLPLTERSPLASSVAGVGGSNDKLANIVRSEQEVFEHHPSATHFRYAAIYGPRHPMPLEWMVVRRILDGRPTMVLPDGGLTVRSRAFAENAAALVLAAVDAPAQARGRVFNVSDAWTPTLRQYVEILAASLGHAFDIVSLPYEYATPSHPLVLMGDAGHRVTPANLAAEVLGYAPPVDVEDGLDRTARWLVDHRPSAAVETWLGDPFDYGAEDDLVTMWRDRCEPLLRTAAARADTGFVPRYGPAADRATGRSKHATPLNRLD